MLGHAAQAACCWTEGGAFGGSLEGGARMEGEAPLRGVWEACDPPSPAPVGMATALTKWPKGVAPGLCPWVFLGVAWGWP